MLPDGMRNACTRNVRSTSQTTSATAMDLVHSQSQSRNECCAGAGLGWGMSGVESR